MLADYLTVDMVQFKKEAQDWEEAIRMAAAPLLAKAAIEQQYVETMIENVKQFGPYIVIMPKFAMPHARPEYGVNKLGLSLLVLEKGVTFESEKSANVFLVLAAPDSDSHLILLSELSSVLASEEKVSALIAAKTYQQVADLLKEEAK